MNGLEGNRGHAPLRVAHFVQRYPPALGGSEAYFARLSRYLVERGDRVTVFTTNALDLEAFWSRRGRCLPAGVSVEDGVAVRRYALWRLPAQRWLLKPLSLVPHRTWQLLCMGHNPIAPDMWRDAGRPDRSFDLVHATAFPYGWPLACGLRLARRLGVPFVLTPFVHTGDPEDPKDRMRRAYTRPALLSLAHAAACVFVQTEVERQALVAAGVAEEKLVVQGMGVDLASCTGGDRTATRRAWGVGPDEMVVGHLANNSWEKGSIDLLQAASRSWGRGARFHLVLAGPEMTNFRGFWVTYPDAARVRRLGVLDEQQKRDFFAALDVFVLPSRSDSFGIVLLEAWANGAANVGYRAGGVTEVIRHEEDGLLVRCGDIDGLAGALARLAADAELRRRFGAAGQAKALREFRWEDKLALVRDVYGRLCHDEHCRRTDS
jgi:glycosyltransferase involved in cell wall biosynthesis